MAILFSSFTISSNASESYISNENDVDNDVVVDVAPEENEFPAIFDIVSLEYISKYAAIEHS